jgi:esterase/lipase superfamily enzyme
MKREYRTIASEAWGRPVEILVYGTKGKPLIVFPSQEGRFYDYENFGMIDTLAPFIQTGKIQVYCIDSLDHESWFGQASPAERARRANDYDYAVVNDIVPHIQADGHEQAGIMLHGCSFGAFHAVNFFLRHPEIFDLSIALSGCYDINFTMGDFFNQDIYFNNPVQYSKGLNNKEIVKQFQKDLLIVCSGQGAWEEWLGEAQTLCRNLNENDIPVILDLWGYDVNHDWPWWKKMIVYFLGKFERSGFLSSNHRLSPKESKEFRQNFHSI